jgi:hypothetical protein
MSCEVGVYREHGPPAKLSHDRVMPTVSFAGPATYV